MATRRHLNLLFYFLHYLPSVLSYLFYFFIFIKCTTDAAVFQTDVKPVAHQPSTFQSVFNFEVLRRWARSPFMHPTVTSFQPARRKNNSTRSFLSNNNSQSNVEVRPPGVRAYVKPLKKSNSNNTKKSHNQIEVSGSSLLPRPPIVTHEAPRRNTDKQKDQETAISKKNDKKSLENKKDVEETKVKKFKDSSKKKSRSFPKKYKTKYKENKTKIPQQNKSKLRKKVFSELPFTEIVHDIPLSASKAFGNSVGSVYNKDFSNNFYKEAKDSKLKPFFKYNHRQHDEYIPSYPSQETLLPKDSPAILPFRPPKKKENKVSIVSLTVETPEIITPFDLQTTPLPIRSKVFSGEMKTDFPRESFAINQQKKPSGLNPSTLRFVFPMRDIIMFCGVLGIIAIITILILIIYGAIQCNKKAGTDLYQMTEQPIPVNQD